MSIFRCEGCRCMENTATSNFWTRTTLQPPLCSACDPEIGRWHGRFPRQPAAGMLLGSDGFLYSQEEFDSGQLDWRIRHQGFTIVGTA